MQGAEKAIADELVPAAEGAGDQAGQRAGSGFSKNLKLAKSGEEPQQAFRRVTGEIDAMDGAARKSF